MDEKKKMLLADFALLLAATFWGMGFVAGDMAAKAFPTFWIMTVRFLGAAVWMGLLFRRAVKSSTKEDIKAGMILGGLLFLAQPLQIIALHNALKAGISGDNVCDNCAVYFVACAAQASTE